MRKQVLERTPGVWLDDHSIEKLLMHSNQQSQQKPEIEMGLLYNRDTAI